MNFDLGNPKDDKKIENETCHNHSDEYSDGHGCDNINMMSSLSHSDNNNVLSSKRLNNESKIFEMSSSESIDEKNILNNIPINTNNSLYYHIPSLCDMLIGFPTQKGFIAYRKPEIGSWYMNAIVQVFSKHSHDTDLCAMLNMVNSIISNEVTNTGKKQMSEYTSKLTKPYFHFFPGMFMQ